jgi:protein SPT2
MRFQRAASATTGKSVSGKPDSKSKPVNPADNKAAAKSSEPAGKVPTASKDKSDPKKAAESAKKAIPSEAAKKVVPSEAAKKSAPKISGPEFHPAVVKPRPQEKPRPKDDPRAKNGVSSSGKPSKPVPSGSKRPRSPETRRSRLPSRSPSPELRRKSDAKRLRIESDESDYDSEMDDFIDDSDAKFDFSAEIRNIFGYDRRRYRDEEDFDDRSMETNRFADVMREEARSAKIGRMEDLEDMRREEEEKRRKMLKKKKR